MDAQALTIHESYIRAAPAVDEDTFALHWIIDNAETFRAAWGHDQEVAA